MHRKANHDYKKELQKDRPSVYIRITTGESISLPDTKENLMNYDFDVLVCLLAQSHVKNQLEKEEIIDILDRCGAVKND